MRMGILAWAMACVLAPSTPQMATAEAQAATI
jgi:hypothetical protein